MRFKDRPKDSCPDMLWSPKRAMVLGAGQSTRMRPLTNELPKPLVQLRDKALIDHVLDRLVDAGVETVIVNVHYFADKLESHLAGRGSPRIEISDEREALLDTGGGVKKALPRLGGDAFFVHNSDSVWIETDGANLERMATVWDSDKMDALLLLAMVTTSIGYHGRGDFAMAPGGLINRRGDREMVPFVFAGVSIMHPRLFANSPDGAFSLNLLWDRAMEQDRLYGIRQEGTWMHVGMPSALIEAEAALELGI